jgi:hypothetical protein
MGHFSGEKAKVVRKEKARKGILVLAQRKL